MVRLYATCGDRLRLRLRMRLRRWDAHSLGALGRGRHGDARRHRTGVAAARSHDGSMRRARNR